MDNRSEPANAARSSLSSLMDGDLADDAVAEACRAWREDGEARACWHTYHLIGDVLRSDDLALPANRDRAFLQQLRQRLADEPVPMAPAPLVVAAQAEPPPVAPGAVPVRRRLGWLVAPAAVAAGFVAVAGVLVVLRSAGPSGGAPGSGPVLAGGPPPSGGVVPVQLVRDARLDRYLDAHRTLANGVAAAGGSEQRVHIVLDAK